MKLSETHQPHFIVRDEPDSKTSKYIKREQEKKVKAFDQLTRRDK